MRVLVCGGRHFKDWDLLSRTLIRVTRFRQNTTIIHGGAKGADSMAAAWADANKAFTVCYRADWGKHGRAAGPIRNQQMIDEGKPDMLVAFPGGRGTADMVSRAKKAGVKVVEVPPPGAPHDHPR